jgi:integrase
MAQQAGWVKTEKRAAGPTWVFGFYITRALDGRRVEHKVALGLVEHLGSKKADAWEEVARQGLRKKINNQTATGRRLTFSELAARYVETQVPNLARTTQYLHRHVIGDYLIQRWGTHPALDIKPIDIQQWLEALAGELATPTRSKLRDVMRRIYKFGILFDLLPPSAKNPVEPVECRRQPGEKKYEPKLLTAAQAAMLVQNFPLLERTLVLVVAATGLRMSEALGLQWQDVDNAGSRLFVRRTWCHGAVGAPKTESSAKPVPMHTILADVVELWHRETPYSLPTDWLFPSTKLKGVQPREGSQIVKDYLRPAAVKLGILSATDNSRFGLHNLRHSLATAMVAAGEDVKTVQGILRHAHSKTTLDIYAHSVETVKVAAQGRYLQDWNTTLTVERAPLQLPVPTSETETLVSGIEYPHSL